MFLRTVDVCGQFTISNFSPSFFTSHIDSNILWNANPVILDPTSYWSTLPSLLRSDTNAKKFHVFSIVSISSFMDVLSALSHNHVSFTVVFHVSHLNTSSSLSSVAVTLPISLLTLEVSISCILPDLPFLLPISMILLIYGIVSMLLNILSKEMSLLIFAHL